MTDIDRFARTMRHARQRAGLTQTEAAKLLEVSRVTVARWEAGIARPQAAQRSAIQRVYEIELKEMVTETLSDAELGAAIESARRAAGLSVEEFAQIIDRSERTILAWERGERRPNAENIAQINLATNADVEEVSGTPRAPGALEVSVAMLEENWEQLTTDQRALLAAERSALQQAVTALLQQAVGLRLASATA